jgi:hypothetical protein
VRVDRKEHIAIFMTEYRARRARSTMDALPLECAGLTALCSLPAPAMMESGVKPPHSKI